MAHATPHTLCSAHCDPPSLASSYRGLLCTVPSYRGLLCTAPCPRPMVVRRNHAASAEPRARARFGEPNGELETVA
eukprot:5041017-Prymnesium_polylepis.1